MKRHAGAPLHSTVILLCLSKVTKVFLLAYALAHGANYEQADQVMAESDRVNSEGQDPDFL